VVNKVPRVFSYVPCLLGATAVLFVGCAAAALAVPSAPASRPASPAQAAAVWLIFVDDLHLDFPATGRLKDLFKKVSTELVREGDFVGVVSTGPSSIAIDLTRDRGRLTLALEKMSGAALKPSEILAVSDRDSSEVRYRAHVTFDTAYGVLRMLARVPNTHKAFIYISNGYYFDVWPGSVRLGVTNPFTLKGNEVSLERLRDEIAELTDQAKRANVPFYAIDPRGLSGPVTIDPKVDDAAWQKYWTTTRNSLHVIAEQTGGFVIEEDVEGNLKRVANAIR
jgi:VWFA-related protein